MSESDSDLDTDADVQPAGSEASGRRSHPPIPHPTAPIRHPLPPPDDDDPSSPSSPPSLYLPDSFKLDSFAPSFDDLAPTFDDLAPSSSSRSRRTPPAGSAKSGRRLTLTLGSPKASPKHTNPPHSHAHTNPPSASSIPWTVVPPSNKRRTLLTSLPPREAFAGEALSGWTYAEDLLVLSLASSHTGAPFLPCAGRDFWQRTMGHWPPHYRQVGAWSLKDRHLALRRAEEERRRGAGPQDVKLVDVAKLAPYGKPQGPTGKRKGARAAEEGAAAGLLPPPPGAGG
ncbi:hypothetical protein TeGR_g8939, partial [Tetraparma gracilis]